MLEWLFGKREDVLKEETKRGFELVKKDITSISGWIKHLDSEDKIQKRDILDIREDMSTMKEEVENLKNIISMMNEVKIKQPFKTPVRVFDKQTVVSPVQTSVQTSVQTPELNQFSITERAIIWVLINTDMNLSYEDIAAMLGKEKSTIRGQINSIRSKSEGLIEELIEKNGKKRVFIPLQIKEKMLKKPKVRVNSNKKERKKEE